MASGIGKAYSLALTRANTPQNRASAPLASNSFMAPITGGFRHLKAVREDASLPATLNVIVETPRGSPNKYSLHRELDLFELKTVLPKGAFFPYDFGFIPQTRAPDGDPLDVLILMDEPTFTGCLVPCRLIGNLVAEQQDGPGKAWIRNDRLIAIAQGARTYEDIHELRDLAPTLIHEIEHFFHSYNEGRGRKFRILRHDGAARAWATFRQFLQRRDLGGAHQVA